MIQVTKRLLACCFLLIAAACAGPSNEQFASMANAGKAFTAQVPAVYQFAFDQELKDSTARFQRDHQKLLSNQESASDANGQMSRKTKAEQKTAQKTDKDNALSELAKNLGSNNQALRERKALFDAMVRQSDLLNRYFTQVGLLAGGSEADKAGAAANEAAKALSVYVSGLSMKVGNDKPVNEVFGSVTGLVIGQLSNKALKENLEAHGKSILGAIRVQSEMLAQLQKNALDARAAKLDAELATALRGDEPLPAAWAAKRADLLSPKAELNPISTALKASQELETAFRSLSAGGTGGVDELNRAIVITETLINAFGG